MTGFLLYLLKVVACSGILFGYYWLFLRNKQFHHYNRFYLLAVLILSISLPLMRVHLTRDEPGQRTLVYKAIDMISISEGPDIAGNTDKPAAGSTGWPSDFITYLFYYIIAAIFAIHLALSLWSIRKLARSYPFERMGRLKFYSTQAPGTPFSFFRSIFWNEKVPLNTRPGQQIFRHEIFHVQQKHSLDLLLTELLIIAFWFNPIFHLVKKELKAIHEFLADQYAISDSDRYAYAELLVEQAIGSKRSLVNPFYQTHIKRRLMMIMRIDQFRNNWWSRLMVLPLLTIIFCAVTLKAQQAASSANNKLPAASNDSRASIAPVPSQTGLPNPANNNRKVTSLLNKDGYQTAGKPSRESAGNTDNELRLHNSIIPSPIPLSPDESVTRPLEDSLLIAVIRHFNRTLRYPQLAIDNKIEGSIYCSVTADESNELKDFQLYEDKPNTNGASIHEINIVAYRRSTTVPKEIPDVEQKLILIDEVKRTAGWKMKTPGPASSGITNYYLKINFRLEEAEPIFTKTEIEAAFIGGNDGWDRFIGQHLRFPAEAIGKELKGSATVTFVVDKQGKVNHVEVISGPKEVQDEVKYLIGQSSGKWRPALQNGRPVSSYLTKTFVFKLHREKGGDQ